VREAFLRQLNVSPDEREIDALVEQYVASSEAAGQQAMQDPKNWKLAYLFLENAFALYLLASEPRSRASKLAQRLYSEHVISKHKGTTLLALILKAFGPYPHGDRNTVHRDSIVLEYLMCRDLLPSEVPSYLGTRGQGLDATYRVAEKFFHPNDPRHRPKPQIIIKPKAQTLLDQPRIRGNIFGFLAESPNAFVMKDVLTDPVKVQKVVEFINSMDET
jgi:hypothetical protein